MRSFVSRLGSLLALVLSGFDRARFCGDSRLLNHSLGVQSYCHQQRIKFKDFPDHAESLTKRLRAETFAQLGNIPVQHLNSPDVDKEAVALGLAQQHGLKRGRIAFITCQESGLTYRVRRNGQGLVEPRKEKTRCVHQYHYFLHEQLGLCHVRIQTWFPFSVRVVLNGRHWLARQLEREGIAFEQRGNLISAVADPQRAQELLDQQPHAVTPALFEELVRPVHPLWDYLHRTVNTPLYWMAEQTEWATDFVFQDPRELARWYPRWIRHGIDALGCKDVLRYLGKKVPAIGYGSCTGEAKIDLRTRPDGTRLKFWYDTNSLKIYDKEGRSLRIETTINQPKGFMVYRTKEGEEENATKSWQQLRKGIADLPRRAEISQSANNRLAESLAAVDEDKSLGKLAAPLGLAVIENGKRRARPLNPLVGPDGELLTTVGRGDFLINGFRNRDIRIALYGVCADEKERRRQAGRVTRQLALLRAHGLIFRVNKTHRYQVSALGKRLTAVLAAAKAANTESLAA